MIKLRRTGVCAGCDAAVGQAEKAWWDAQAKQVWCLRCHNQRVPSSAETKSLLPQRKAIDLQAVVDQALASQVPYLEQAPAAVLDRGTPGKSAQEEYERRHRKEQERLEQKWGRLAGIAKFFHDDPQSTTAYAKGAIGERRVASFLEQTVGDRGLVLHDRSVPGTKGNIDHLAVVASGIWIIDAKHYKGKIEQQDVGGMYKTDLRLRVGGRDCSKLADGLGWQVLAVAKIVGNPNLPIHPALCFVECGWGMFPKPFRQAGVLVAPPGRLAEMVNARGPLSDHEIRQITTALARGLPAK